MIKIINIFLFFLNILSLNHTIHKCEINKNLKSTDLLIKYQNLLLPNLIYDSRFAVILLKMEDLENSSKNEKKIVYKIFDKDFEFFFIGILFEEEKGLKLKIKKYIQSENLKEISDLLKIGVFKENVICKNFAENMKIIYEEFLKEKSLKFCPKKSAKKKEFFKTDKKIILKKEGENLKKKIVKKKEKINIVKKIKEKKDGVKWVKKPNEISIKNKKQVIFDKISIELLNGLYKIYGFSYYKTFFKLRKLYKNK